MARTQKAIRKGNHSQSYYLLLSRPTSEGKRLLKLRLSVDGQKTPIDIGMKFNRKKISVFPSNFENGSITGGYDNKTLHEINLLLLTCKMRAVELADEMVEAGKVVTTEYINQNIYRNPVLESTEREVMRVRGVSLTDQDVLRFNSEIASGEYRDADTNELMFESKEDVADYMLSSKLDDEISKLPAEKRFEYPSGIGWSKDNIFHALGYIRFGTRINAAKKRVKILNKTFDRLYFKLLTYKVNGKPSERTSDFDEHWVHDFYRFLKEYGHNGKVHKLSHDPFHIDPKYKFTDTSKHKHYSINTFGEQIHKGMVKYIKLLYQQGLIPNNFSDRIEAEAFAEATSGQLSKYNNIIYNLTVGEFLNIVHADLSTYDLTRNEFKTLDETKDLFVCAVLMGALRVSDLQADKIVTQIDGFKTIQFEQKKTGGMVNNLMLKPVENILGKYKGNLPQMLDTKYNEQLKRLFKLLGFDRSITKVVTTMSTETKEVKPLYDWISSKFARSTYYVLGAAMREPIEILVKRAGHDNTDIVMTHYYDVGKNYTEDELNSLLSMFN